MIFRFKQFSVLHGKSSMKAGTDAVLLGVWSDFEKAKRILDVGTGCGIIALIAAQKNQNAEVIGIDIDKNSIDEASVNFENCNWNKRMRAVNISFQDFSKTSKAKFDKIVCNPPYFNNSTPSPNYTRHLARHSIALNPDEFFKSCNMIITEKSTISIIVPTLEYENWRSSAEFYNFFEIRKTDVFSYYGKVSERKMIEFSQKQTIFINSEIYIRDGKNSAYSKQYIDLTKDFYLDLLNSQR